MSRSIRKEAKLKTMSMFYLKAIVLLARLICSYSGRHKRQVFLAQPKNSSLDQESRIRQTSL